MLFPNNASTVLFSSILENGNCNNIILTRQVSAPVRERLTWKVVWYFQVFFFGYLLAKNGAKSLSNTSAKKDAFLVKSHVRKDDK